MVAVQEGQVDLLLVSRANPARPAGRRVSAACTRLPRALARKRAIRRCGPASDTERPFPPRGSHQGDSPLENDAGPALPASPGHHQDPPEHRRSE
jgi:hypothetical protein